MKKIIKYKQIVKEPLLKKFTIIIFVGLITSVITLMLSSCNKLVKIGPQKNSLDPSVVFADSSSVQAALVGNYSYMYYSASADQPYGAGITYLNSLYTDEVSGTVAPSYLDNALTAADAGVESIWAVSYSAIGKANAIIDGVTSVSGLSANAKSRALGEAAFQRAFCYFYLVNLYGGVPIVISNAPLTNAKLPRSSVTSVYQQITADLKIAVTNLPPDYSISGGQRVRASRFAATALLAKVYLQTNDYVDAEAMATNLINNTQYFALGADLTKVFLKGSTEAIFQFDCSALGYPYISALFNVSPGGTPLFPVTTQLINAFETGDARKTDWIGTSVGLYYPAKYKSLPGGTLSEFDMPLRLGEQYLIRAEARAQQNNIAGAQADINAIRNRAGLGNTTASDMASLLLAVEQERRVELFCEWGNRFFDLKRLGRIDAVLGAEKPGIWKSTSALYPIPAIEIANNPNLTQNPGY